MIRIVGYFLLGALAGAILGAICGGVIGITTQGTENGFSGALVYLALGVWAGSVLLAIGGAVWGFVRYRRVLDPLDPDRGE